MKIILAFDSFKGSLSAPRACAAAGEGLARLAPPPEVLACPLSDGGEGFAEALRLAAGGELLPVVVTGPLGEQVTAEIALLDGGRTAVIEAAQACGLQLVPPALRNPLHTTTFGVGEMLAAAIAAGAQRLVVGLGGSATNDGGLGLLAALGWQFLDARGQGLPPVGASLALVQQIMPGRSCETSEVIVACDVTNPLYGPHGAAATFAPQKGAAPEEVAALDAGMQHFAARCAAFLGSDFAATPGAGAAGGLGFALLAFLHAHYRSGAELAISLSRLDVSLRDANLCITGEGQTDAQTAYGKLPAVVAARCRQAGVPCVCLSGALGEGWRALYQHGFTALFSISSRPQPLPAALAAAPTALADTAEAVARVFGACSGRVLHHKG